MRADKGGAVLGARAIGTEWGGEGDSRLGGTGRRGETTAPESLFELTIAWFSRA